MDRRRLLAVGGVSLGSLGGCLSLVPGTGTESSDDGPGVSPTASATADPGAGVVVEDIVARKAVTYEASMGSGGVLAVDGRQYVVASVRTTREHSDLAFEIAAAERTWEPGLSGAAGLRTRHVAGTDGGAVGDSMGPGDRGYLAFEVPSPLSASTPSIRLTTGDAAWPLPDAARERLAAPEPRFELEALSVPAEISQGDPLSVSLSVSNVAAVGGRFLAAIYWPTALIYDDDESWIVEREVSTGEGARATVEVDTAYTTDEAGPVTLRVDGHVGARREVEVGDVSTPD